MLLNGHHRRYRYCNGHNRRGNVRGCRDQLLGSLVMGDKILGVQHYSIFICCHNQHLAEAHQNEAPCHGHLVSYPGKGETQWANLVCYNYSHRLKRLTKSCHQNDRSFPRLLLNLFLQPTGKLAHGSSMQKNVKLVTNRGHDSCFRRLHAVQRKNKTL